MEFFFQYQHGANPAQPEVSPGARLSQCHTIASQSMAEIFNTTQKPLSRLCIVLLEGSTPASSNDDK